MGDGDAEGSTAVHRTSRGSINLSSPAPAILLLEYKGFADETFVSAIERVWNERLTSVQGVRVFVDAELQVGNTKEFHAGLLRLGRRILPQLSAVVLLTKSRWVSVGAAVLRATLRASCSVTVTMKRSSFDAELDRAVGAALRMRGESGESRS